MKRHVDLLGRGRRESHDERSNCSAFSVCRSSSLFQAFDHILAAVEDIAGLNGYHHWRDKSVLYVPFVCTKTNLMSHYI